jgi:hypothetical protein
MPKTPVDFPDFRGGLNLDTAEIQCAMNELILAENADIVERGGAGKRWGTDFVTAEMATGKYVKLIEWGRHDDTVFDLAVYKPDSGFNNHLLKISDTGTTTLIYDGLSQKRVGHYFHGGYLYLVDGANYLRWNGTDSVVEVPPQTQTQTGDPVQDCDLTPVKACTLAVRHPKSQRIFFGGDGTERVYFTEIGDPTYVKQLSFTVPHSGDGRLTGLALFIDALVAVYKTSAWIWRGIDPSEDAIWERLPLAEGSESPDTLEITLNAFEFLGNGGGHWAMAPALISAATVVNPGQGLLTNLAEGRVQKLIGSIVNRELACSAYDVLRHKTFLAYCDDVSLDYCNKMLVLDYDAGGYTTYSGMEVRDIIYKQNGEIWMAMTGYITKFKDWRRDACPDGTYKAIPFDIQTPNSALGEPFRNKWVNWLRVLFYNPGYEDYILRVRVYADEILVMDVDYTPDSPKDFVSALFDEINDGIGNTISIRVTNDQFDYDAIVYGMRMGVDVIANSYGGVL